MNRRNFAKMTLAGVTGLFAGNRVTAKTNKCSLSVALRLIDIVPEKSIDYIESSSVFEKYTIEDKVGVLEIPLDFIGNGEKFNTWIMPNHGNDGFELPKTGMAWIPKYIIGVSTEESNEDKALESLNKALSDKINKDAAKLLFCAAASKQLKSGNIITASSQQRLISKFVMELKCPKEDIGLFIYKGFLIGVNKTLAKDELMMISDDFKTKINADKLTGGFFSLQTIGMVVLNDNCLVCGKILETRCERT